MSSKRTSRGVMARIREHLTYANVMVTILAFIVLGGGTALASYLVSSNSQIGPNTVSGHKPPSGKHANLIGGSLNAQDLATGAVTLNKQGANSVNTSKVVNGSLLATDFAPGQLPAKTVIVRTAAVHPTPSSSIAACNSGERAVGGGGAITSPGDSLQTSAPYVFDGANYTLAAAGDTPNAWGISTGASSNPPVWVVCASS